MHHALPGPGRIVLSIVCGCKEWTRYLCKLSLSLITRSAFLRCVIKQSPQEMLQLKLYTFSQTSVLIQSSGSSTDTTDFTADPHQGGSGRGCGCQEDSLLEDSQTALCSSIKDTSVLHQCFSIKDTSVLHQCSKPGRHGSSHSLQCDEKKLHEVNEASSGSKATMLTDATLSTTWLGSEIDFLCEDTSTHSTCSTDSSSLQDALQAGVSMALWLT